MYNKEIEHAKRHFENHVAKFQQHDGLSVLDWRNKNGSIEYYVRYVFDEARGYLYISGDLGDACVHLTEKATLKTLSRYINMLGYFVEKIRCSTDLYSYDVDYARAELNQFLIGDDEDEMDPENLAECKSLINDLVEEMDHFDGWTHLSEDLRNRLDEWNSDWWEWISSCGRRVHLRVICWLVGLNMAFKQLSEKV